MPPTALPPSPEAEDAPEMLLIEQDALDAEALAAADLPDELEDPAEPPNPRVVKVRRLAIGSILLTLFAPFTLGPILGTVLGLWALALPHDDDETLNRWRVFAAFGALAGLAGIWLAVTKTSY